MVVVVKGSSINFKARPQLIIHFIHYSSFKFSFIVLVPKTLGKKQALPCLSVWQKVSETCQTNLENGDLLTWTILLTWPFAWATRLWELQYPGQLEGGPDSLHLSSLPVFCMMVSFLLIARDMATDSLSYSLCHRKVLWMPGYEKITGRNSDLFVSRVHPWVTQQGQGSRGHIARHMAARKCLPVWLKMGRYFPG